MIEEKLYVRPDVFEKYNTAMKHDYFSSAPLKVKEISEGIVLPSISFTDGQGFERYKGGVVNDIGQFVNESAHYREKIGAFWGSLIEGYKPQPKIEYDEREVIYGGLIFEHFGHFLIESTGRLWYYLQNGKNHPVAFVAPGKVKKFVYEFLELIGLKKENIIIIKKPVRFKKIIVPQSSFAIRNYFTKEFILPYQNNKAPANSIKRIYLTRTKFKNGPKTFGEEILEKAFADNGYKIIAPELLSLKEQIAYIKGAESIAGIMGTATHLALFAKPGTELILINRSDDLNNNQIMVNQAASLTVCRVDGHLNFLPTSHTDGPFVMGITDCLLQLFKDKNYKIDDFKLNYLKQSSIKLILNEWLRIYSRGHEHQWLPEAFQPYTLKAAACIRVIPEKRKWFHLIYYKEKTLTHKIFTICGLKISFKRKAKSKIDN